MINRVSKLAQRKMTPEQVEAYQDTENAKLRALYKDTWDQRFEPARRMIHEVELKKPGLKKFLLANGVGDDSGLANMLINHAPIFWAKRNARKGRS
jgi:hypothetical protein